MSKNKLKKFKEVTAFSNTIELTDFQDNAREKPAGRWNSEVFENENPIIVELACGKGEYTCTLAQEFPDYNYVGIDIKGARIWKGAKRALDNDWENVRFLRIYIDHLAEYFAPDEIHGIWITFPDPYPRRSKRLKRLTSPKFLEIYKKVMQPDGLIHFKTDSDSLFQYTLSVIEAMACPLYRRVDDIYGTRPDDELLTTKTYYEKKHLANGKTIKYLEFGLPRKMVENPKKIG